LSISHKIANSLHWFPAVCVSVTLFIINILLSTYQYYEDLVVLHNGSWNSCKYNIHYFLTFYTQAALFLKKRLL